MRIGLIAQPHRTGIGNQTWAFALNMSPSKVLLTNLKQVHERYGKIVTRTDWFDSYNYRECAIPTTEDVEWITDDVDIIFVVETPLNWWLFERAREKGVKTVLQYNYEFLEYFVQPDLPKPDLFMAPSKWNIENVWQFGEVEYVPVPVDIDQFEPRVVKKAKKFVHIAGHTTHADRNGSDMVRAAWPLVTADVELVWHSQTEGKETENYWELYDEGDILLIPRRYGGLSLQIQEAMAAGMVPLVGWHDPYADFSNVLVTPSRESEVITTRGQVQTFDCSPTSLAMTIEHVATLDLEGMSLACQAWSEENSWESLKPKYTEVLENVIRS